MSRELPLADGSVTLVDDEDYDFLSQWVWRRDAAGYVTRWCRENGQRKTIRMHALLLNTPAGMHTDHINSDKLDNRRANLRIASVAQNHFNTAKVSRQTSSRYIGVYWHRQIQKWSAGIAANRKRIHLGVFDNEIDAAKARDKAARKYHGEFARLNFSEEERAS